MSHQITSKVFLISIFFWLCRGYTPLQTTPGDAKGVAPITITCTVISMLYPPPLPKTLDPPLDSVFKWELWLHVFDHGIFHWLENITIFTHIIYLFILWIYDDENVNNNSGIKDFYYWSYRTIDYIGKYWRCQMSEIIYILIYDIKYIGISYEPYIDS